MSVTAIAIKNGLQAIIAQNNLAPEGADITPQDFQTRINDFVAGNYHIPGQGDRATQRSDALKAIYGMLLKPYKQYLGRAETVLRLSQVSDGAWLDELELVSPGVNKRLLEAVAAFDQELTTEFAQISEILKRKEVLSGFDFNSLKPDGIRAQTFEQAKEAVHSLVKKVAVTKGNQSLIQKVNAAFIESLEAFKAAKPNSEQEKASVNITEKVNQYQRMKSLTAEEHQVIAERKATVAASNLQLAMSNWQDAVDAAYKAIHFKKSVSTDSEKIGVIMANMQKKDNMKNNKVLLLKQVLFGYLLLAVGAVSVCSVAFAIKMTAVELAPIMMGISSALLIFSLWCLYCVRSNRLMESLEVEPIHVTALDAEEIPMERAVAAPMERAAPASVSGVRPVSKLADAFMR